MIENFETLICQNLNLKDLTESIRCLARPEMKGLIDVSGQNFW